LVVSSGSDSVISMLQLVGAGSGRMDSRRR
jgi:hypothetical protein